MKISWPRKSKAQRELEDYGRQGLMQIASQTFPKAPWEWLPLDERLRRMTDQALTRDRLLEKPPIADISVLNRRIRESLAAIRKQEREAQAAELVPVLTELLAEEMERHKQFLGMK